MINIISRSRDFTKVEEYLMTVAPSIKSLKDVEDDTVIPVAGVINFIDTKDDTNEDFEVLSIITPNKEVYSCQSKTFKRSLNDIMSIMGDQPFSIIKISGTTNAGRGYINCILDVTSVE